MVFKNVVKNIQAAAFNDMRTLIVEQKVFEGLRI